MHTYTGENYLKAIYKLSEHSEKEVTVTAVDHGSVSGSSKLLMRRFFPAYQAG